MSYSAGPRATYNGLICSLDIRNTKSFVNGSSAAIDLSGNNSNGTTYNGPIFLENSGSLLFDGTNEYIGITSPNDKFSWTPSSGSTLNFMSAEIWIKTLDSTGRIFSKPWNGSGEYNYWVDGSGWSATISSSGYTLPCSTFATGKWEHFIYTLSPISLTVYKNGKLDAGPTSHGITGNTPAYGNNGNDLAVMTLYPYGAGSWNYPTHAINGELGMFRVYNRVLTASEILKNYSITKGRFGY
jgi:hypothetical protein